MFVAQLDRPWLDTPFALQGFFIQSPKDVESLAEYCDYVYVDPRRAHAAHLRTARKPIARAQRRAVVYLDGVSMKDEFVSAKVDYETAAHAVTRVFDEIRRGQPLDVAAMIKVVNPLIDSVLRNKDALAALVRVKKKDNYTYGHCLSTAVWAVVLGRHLGLDKSTLRRLAIGCAISDVGKVKLADNLLIKPAQLSDAEQVQLRQHVQFSLDILSTSSEADPRVFEIVELHHERHDGSGYPYGHAGTAIPLLARIAGMVDSYDAMISSRPYAVARSSFQAMQELSDLKDEKFQGELVEQFMQAVGLFPTGSLVELNTGEVGIVIAQNSSRRLKPKVMIVLDIHKQRCQRCDILDLLALDSPGRRPATVWISKELSPGAYGVNADEFYL